MKIQRIVTLLCTAALLLCAASTPALAADRSAACYYPVEVESYTAGDFDQPRIRKVYQLSRSYDPAGIPTEDFEEYGRTFHLMEMTRKDEIGVETQPLTKTVTTDSATGDLGEILKQLAPEIEAETEDGYAGMLKLDYNSVQAEVKGYKTSYWDAVPDWAKGEDGKWMVAYTGVTTFLVNTDQVSKVPTSWQDIRDGDYKVAIGPLSGGNAQGAFIASTYAFGGRHDQHPARHRLLDRDGQRRPHQHPGHHPGQL